MYTPKHFEIRDPDLIWALMERWSFATLITIDNGVPVGSHLPFLVDRDRNVLISHMARANGQWRTFSEHEVLTIFQGEHGYISPSWYAPQPAVPTWNYLVVHAYGVPRIIDDDAALAMLGRVIAQHEAAFDQPWQMDREYAVKLLRGIVAFEIAITRLEGKFKLSQNRSDRDQAGVIEALIGSDHPLDRELGRQMQAMRERA
jgi:transcriptional regulator